MLHGTIRRVALATAFVVLPSAVALENVYPTPNGQVTTGVVIESPPGTQVGPGNPLPVQANVTSAPATAPGAYSGVSVGTTSSQVLGAATGRAFLDLKNESTSQPIACSLGGTAALNTAGSFTIAPGGDKTWEGSFVPSDQVNCITSTGTAPLTIGVH